VLADSVGRPHRRADVGELRRPFFASASESRYTTEKSLTIVVEDITFVVDVFVDDANRKVRFLSDRKF
jgi:hypothetical protein